MEGNLARRQPAARPIWRGTGRLGRDRLLWTEPRYAIGYVRYSGFGAALGLLSNLSSEVWDRIGLGVDAVVASLQASWSGITATVADAMQGALGAVVGFGNSSAGVFQGAYDAMKAIWGALPAAIGDFAFQAANGLISGVEAMLNGVVTRINTFISGLNAALDMLPDWATLDVTLDFERLGSITSIPLLEIRR